MTVSGHPQRGREGSKPTPVGALEHRRFTFARHLSLLDDELREDCPIRRLHPVHHPRPLHLKSASFPHIKLPSTGRGTAEAGLQFSALLRVEHRHLMDVVNGHEGLQFSIRQPPPSSGEHGHRQCHSASWAGEGPVPNPSRLTTPSRPFLQAGCRKKCTHRGEFCNSGPSNLTDCSTVRRSNTAGGVTEYGSRCLLKRGFER
jgi:hypothetical protein